MKNSILKDNELYSKREYKIEEALTKLFNKYYKNIISENSFWIPFEKKVKSKNFKNFKHSISDGFLLVWDNPTTPIMYITEIELEEHDINKHILPQIGNFISFIQSADKEELNRVRDFLYNEIRKNNLIFEKLQKDTRKEVHQLLDNSMEDLEILLLIDRISPELSIGLSQIEKAIKVKIRKIEVSMFLSDKKDEVILFSDSEKYQDEAEESKQAEEYSVEYHLGNKSDEVRAIINDLFCHISNLGIQHSPVKHYIGFYKNNNMIFSCVIRKNSVIFYSKAKINEIKIDDIKLQFRDVSKIGHYTNHLPTEIIVSKYDDLLNFNEYLDRLYKKY